MNMKKIVMIIMAALIVIAGAGNIQIHAEETGDIRGRIYEKQEEFRESKQIGDSIRKICMGVVVGGVLFKLGAIVLGIIQGRLLGKKLKEGKERKKIAMTKSNMDVPTPMKIMIKNDLPPK